MKKKCDTLPFRCLKSHKPPALIQADILVIAFESADVLDFSDDVQDALDNGLRVCMIRMADAMRVKSDKRIQIIPMKYFGISGRISRLRWHRHLSFTDAVVKRITQRIRARKVLTGITSHAQAQLARSFKNQQSTCIARYRGLALLDEGMLVNIVQMRPDSLEIISKVQLGRSIGKVSRLTKIIEVKYGNRFETNQIAQSKNNEKHILFIGGYGQNYNAAFCIFLNAVRDLPVKVVVRLHPRVVSGKIERRLVKESGVKGVVFSQSAQTLSQLIVHSLAVCSQNSTALFDAHLMGIRAYYVDIPDTNYMNLPLLKGLIKRFTDAPRLKRALLDVMQHKGLQ